MTPQRRSLILGTIVSVVAIVVVIVGIVVIGSPMTRRQLREDALRVNSLRNVFGTLGTYDIDKEPMPLPATLEDLPKRPNAYIQPTDIRDPVTKEVYEYRVLSETTYELCATFALPSTAEERGYDATAGTFWEHPAGRHCFTLSTVMNDILPARGGSMMIDEPPDVEKAP